MSWQSKASDDELFKLRKSLFFQYVAATSWNDKDRIDREIKSVSFELNKRFKTTKY